MMDGRVKMEAGRADGVYRGGERPIMKNTPMGRAPQVKRELHDDTASVDDEHEHYSKRSAGDSMSAGSVGDGDEDGDSDGGGAGAVDIKFRPPRKAPVGGKWTDDEDRRLREIVEAHGAKNWKRLASILGDVRSDVQCLHRWNKVLRPGLSKGPWTQEEDRRVKEMVLERGAGNIKWSVDARVGRAVFGMTVADIDPVIASSLPGRIGKQCRERWFNHLDPEIKKGDWTPEEDNVLFETQRIHGNRWSEIAKLLPGRTENAVKNRWNSSARKKWLQTNNLTEEAYQRPLHACSVDIFWKSFDKNGSSAEDSPSNSTSSPAHGFGGAPGYGGAHGYGGAPCYGGAPGYGAAHGYGAAPFYGGAQSYGGAAHGFRPPPLQGTSPLSRAPGVGASPTYGMASPTYMGASPTYAGALPVHMRPPAIRTQRADGGGETEALPSPLRSPMGLLLDGDQACLLVADAALDDGNLHHTGLFAPFDDDDDDGVKGLDLPITPHLRHPGSLSLQGSLRSLGGSLRSLGGSLRSLAGLGPDDGAAAALDSGGPDDKLDDDLEFASTVDLLSSHEFAENTPTADTAAGPKMHFPPVDTALEPGLLSKLSPHSRRGSRNSPPPPSRGMDSRNDDRLASPQPPPDRGGAPTPATATTRGRPALHPQSPVISSLFGTGGAFDDTTLASPPPAARRVWASPGGPNAPSPMLSAAVAPPLPSGALAAPPRRSPPPPVPPAAPMLAAPPRRAPPPQEQEQLERAATVAVQRIVAASSETDVPLSMLPYFHFLNERGQRSIMNQLMAQFGRTSIDPSIDPAHLFAPPPDEDMAMHLDSPRMSFGSPRRMS